MLNRIPSSHSLQHPALNFHSHAAPLPLKAFHNQTRHSDLPPHKNTGNNIAISIHVLNACAILQHRPAPARFNKTTPGLLLAAPPTLATLAAS